tara:strand:- start:360 stop:536 length:177 start_codon:yes stop_codon:yes gene_type:complete
VTKYKDLEDRKNEIEDIILKGGNSLDVQMELLTEYRDIFKKISDQKNKISNAVYDTPR